MSQFKKPAIGAAAVMISLMLAACGGSGHPVCVDEKTTQEYSRQFVTDMIAAAGRLKPDVLKNVETELQGISTGSGQDFAGFCTKVDDIRKKYGI